MSIRIGNITSIGDFTIEEFKIHIICDKYNIKNYKINGDLSVDVDDCVHILSRKLNEIPIKFNYINGDFICINNRIKSLKNSPTLVGGSIFLNLNNLQSLKYGPKTVNGNYEFENNNIINLDGFPKEFKGKVYYKSNPIEEILNLFGENGDKLGPIIDEINRRNLIKEDKTVSMFMLSNILCQFDRDFPNNINLNQYTTVK